MSVAVEIIIGLVLLLVILLAIILFIMIRGTFRFSLGKPPLKNLLEHRLFYAIRTHLAHNIPCVNVGSIEKSILFRGMLKTKYRVVSDIAQKMVSELEQKGFLNDDEFFKWNIRWITSMVTDYEKEWRTSGVSEGMIKTFNDWHSHRVDVLLYEIESVSRSSTHESYHEKQMVIFDLIKYILDMTLYDVERSLLKLESLNGFTFKTPLKEEEKTSGQSV